MADPDRIETWMRWEFDRLNAGVVTRRKSLEALLADATPRLETRDGETYHMDREALERLASACRGDERARLRLPITLRVSADVSDSAYLEDELEASVLRRLEGWGDAYPYRDGKMWLPQSLALDLILRYGGAVQRLLL